MRELNLSINEILNHQWKQIQVSFENIIDTKSSVERNPGLYSIWTDTPTETLRQFGERNDKNHYNLKKKIDASEEIPKNFRINQNGAEYYCVYNGHHHNLRQRLSEHFLGSRGTGCLALFQIEELRKYNWRFDYLDLTTICDYNDSKVFRTLLEQHLRVKSGWPILCGQ